MQIVEVPQEKPTFPMKEAQADMIAQVVAASFAKRPNFERGDAVHFMAGTGPQNKHSRLGLVLRFWRYLDVNNEHDNDLVSGMEEAERVSLPDPDSLTVYFDGSIVGFSVACSYLLLSGDTDD